MSYKPFRSHFMLIALAVVAGTALGITAGFRDMTRGFDQVVRAQGEMPPPSNVDPVVCQPYLRVLAMTDYPHGDVSPSSSAVIGKFRVEYPSQPSCRGEFSPAQVKGLTLGFVWTNQGDGAEVRNIRVH